MSTRLKSSLSNLDATLQAIVSECTNTDGVYTIKKSQLEQMVKLKVISRAALDELRDLGYVDFSAENKHWVVYPSTVWTFKKWR